MKVFDMVENFVYKNTNVAFSTDLLYKRFGGVLMVSHSSSPFNWMVSCDQFNNIIKMDFKEFVDYSAIPLDARIAYNSEDAEHFAHFAMFDGNNVYVFKYGKTSWTAGTDIVLIDTNDITYIENFK